MKIGFMKLTKSQMVVLDSKYKRREFTTFICKECAYLKDLRALGWFVFEPIQPSQTRMQQFTYKKSPKPNVLLIS